MALSKSALKQRIITELQGKGFVTSGEFSLGESLADAIATAVIDEIKVNAKALVSGGQYPIE